jgi:hypothetical protein
MIDAPDRRPDMAQLMAQFHAREALLKAFRPLSISCPPEVVSLVQTCYCHPSQWEGWTSGDGLIYIRFRYGRLWIGLAPDWGVTPTTLFVARYPGEDGDDGFLRFETLTRLTEGVVDWP